MKWITLLLSTLIVFVCLAAFNYFSYPVTDHFEWQSINPLEAIRGFIFTLAYFRINDDIARTIVAFIIVGVIFLLNRLLRKLLIK
ncbi:MAG: hypothetical protein ACRCXN_08560 [Bacteroidales bacterium]